MSIVYIILCEINKLSLNQSTVLSFLFLFILTGHCNNVIVNLLSEKWDGRHLSKIVLSILYITYFKRIVKPLVSQNLTDFIQFFGHFIMRFEKLQRILKITS